MLDEATGNYTLGATAHWTAAVRARESEREDRLFDDPWAQALAGSTGETWIAERSAESVIPISLRTRFFDDFLQKTVCEAGIRQVVLLAAGLDTRAYRLSWPEETQFFELDQGPVLAYKEDVLRTESAVPTCQRRSVPADLTASWEAALAQAGFDPYLPGAWLLEGFLFYLAGEHVVSVLERVLGLATSGSYIGFDIINSLTLTSPLTRGWVQMQADSGAPWLGTLDDPWQFLAERGWQATVTAPGATEANYGRWPYPVIPAEMPGMPHLWYVTARKPRAL